MFLKYAIQYIDIFCFQPHFCLLIRRTSNNTDKTAFHECYNRLHELRALVPLANILALTATATRDTTSTLSAALLFKDPFVIYQSPDKPNIAYSVQYIKKDHNSLEHCFKQLSDELIEHGTNTTRTITLLSNHETMYSYLLYDKSNAYKQSVYWWKKR